VMRVRITGPAADDLRAIRAYIARDNQAAAGSVVRRIRTHIGRLRRYPELGRPGRISGTRELVVGGLPYLVVYRVTESAVEMARVLHHAQDWPPA
jgi:toxin ParE1/3/4